MLNDVIAVTNRKLSQRPFLEQIKRVCQLRPEAIILREKDLSEIDDIISKLRIKPKLISINGNDIDLFFQPNQVINLKSNNDYTELVFSFIDYISEYADLGIKFIGWNLENHKFISNISNNDSNNSFTEELFNWEKCDIYDWGEQLIEV